MDMMAMVSSVMALQAGNLQQQIATSMIKQNADAEKFAVQPLLELAENPPYPATGPTAGTACGLLPPHPAASGRVSWTNSNRPSPTLPST